MSDIPKIVFTTAGKSIARLSATEQLRTLNIKKPDQVLDRDLKHSLFQALLTGLLSGVLTSALFEFRIKEFFTGSVPVALISTYFLEKDRRHKQTIIKLIAQMNVQKLKELTENLSPDLSKDMIVVEDGANALSKLDTKEYIDLISKNLNIGESCDQAEWETEVYETANTIRLAVKFSRLEMIARTSFSDLRALQLTHPNKSNECYAANAMLKEFKPTLSQNQPDKVNFDYTYCLEAKIQDLRTIKESSINNDIAPVKVDYSLSIYIKPIKYESKNRYDALFDV